MREKLLRITLIEEDEDDQLIFSTIVESSGIPTDLTIIKDVKDVQKNISILESISPDIIFLGCPLVLRKEIEYIQQIRQNSLLQKVFCVVYSGYNIADFVQDTFNAGANLYIAKSTDTSVLTTSVYKVLHLDRDNYFPPKLELYTLTPLMAY